jgi:hypothetical protein
MILSATDEVIDFYNSLPNKEAKEIIRINLTVLGLCPQCSGDNYRSGICEDCGFISPEVQEAIKEFEESQNTTVKVPKQKSDDEEFTPGYPKLSSSFKKEASPSGASTYYEYMKKNHGQKVQLCPNGHLMDETGLFCKEPNCPYERPPSQLDFKSPSFTGINPNIEQKRVFISPAEKRITVMKNKIKTDKKNKKTSKKSENSNEDMNDAPGTTLDDASIAANDKITRGHQMLEDAAKIKYFQNLQVEDEETN